MGTLMICILRASHETVVNFRVFEEYKKIGEEEIKVNFSASRKIDELGRVVLPVELRRLLDWDTSDTLSVTHNETDNSVVLKLSEKHRGAKCVFCGAAEEAVKLNNRGICNACLTKIKET